MQMKVLAYAACFLVGAALFFVANFIENMLPEKLKIEYLDGKEKKGIGALRSVIIYILGGILAMLLAHEFGLSIKSFIMIIFFAILAIITYIDADTMEIPFFLNVIIFVLGIISIWAIPEISIVERIIGMLCISLPLFLIVLVIPEGFGGGDIKLMFAAGFLLGWKATVAAFLIGLILGGAYGIICLAKRKRGKKDHFAFGPFLAVGLAVSVFAGDQIMGIYINMLKSSFEV